MNPIYAGRERSEEAETPLTWYHFNQRLQTNRDLNAAVLAGKRTKENLCEKEHS